MILDLTSRRKLGLDKEAQEDCTAANEMRCLGGTIRLNPMFICEDLGPGRSVCPERLCISAVILLPLYDEA